MKKSSILVLATILMLLALPIMTTSAAPSQGQVDRPAVVLAQAQAQTTPETGQATPQAGGGQPAPGGATSAPGTDSIPWIWIVGIGVLLVVIVAIVALGRGRGGAATSSTTVVERDRQP